MSSKRVTCALVLLLVFSNHGAMSAALSQDQEDRVTAAILLSHQQLSEKFHPTQVVIRFEEREAPGSAKVHRESSFFRSGESVLVETTLDIWGANDEYQFHLRRESPVAGWTIVELASRTDPTASSLKTTTALGRNNFQEFLVANHIPIIELFTHPHVHISALSDETDGGDRIVRVDFVVDDPNAKLNSGLDIRFAAISLFFTPQESGWIPTRVELTGPKGDGLIEFQSGFVKVDDTVVPVEFKTIGRLSNGTEWVLTSGHAEYGFDPLPQEMFYLSHFGLPEPSNAQPSSHRLWWILAAAAFICLPLYAALRYRTRQQA